MAGEHRPCQVGKKVLLLREEQGIEDFSKVSISYIPTGSSNDLARDMGISRNPEEALEAILKAEKEIYMDMGIVHYEQAFLNGKEMVNLNHNLTRL